jgi:hypothetical protein
LKVRDSPFRNGGVLQRSLIILNAAPASAHRSIPSNSKSPPSGRGQFRPLESGFEVEDTPSDDGWIESHVVCAPRRGLRPARPARRRRSPPGNLSSSICIGAINHEPMSAEPVELPSGRGSRAMPGRTVRALGHRRLRNHLRLNSGLLQSDCFQMIWVHAIASRPSATRRVRDARANDLEAHPECARPRIF